MIRDWKRVNFILNGKIWWLILSWLRKECWFQKLFWWLIFIVCRPHVVLLWAHLGQYLDDWNCLFWRGCPGDHFCREISWMEPFSQYNSSREVSLIEQWTFDMLVFFGPWIELSSLFELKGQNHSKQECCLLISSILFLEWMVPII